MNRSYSLLLFCLLFPWPDAAQAASKTLQADSKAFIVPVLELRVSQQGAQELSFGDIAPSGTGPTEAQPRTILIEVTCNSGEKYQVTQALSGELKNAEGTTIPLSYLKFKTTAAKSTGHSVSDFTPVAPSARTIFTSDDQGSSESISTLYQLTIPPSQAPGDYSALLTYTVSSV